MNFGIRQKLFSGFVVVILLFSGTCFMGFTYLQNVAHSLERTLAYPIVINRASQDIEVLVLSIQRTMYAISLSRDKKEIDGYTREIKLKENKAFVLLSTIQDLMLISEGKLMVHKTRLDIYNWRIMREKAIALALSGKYDQAQEITKTYGDNYVKVLQRELDDIADYAIKRIKLFTEQSIRSAKTANLVGLIAIILSIMTSLIISFYLALSITRRLKSISVATTLMAKGKIKQSLEIKGHDELTQVAENFNDMASELAQTYENLENKVKERTSELNKANEELYRAKSDLESKVIERTKDLEEKISELNRSQLAMLYMIEDMNDTSRKLKSTQEELIRKERLAILGQFSGNISHELRNPLGVIDSSIYYLQMRLNEKDEKVNQHLNRISRSVKTATTIIENLLNLTRLVKPVMNRYDLAGLLTDCLDQCKIPETVTLVKEFDSSEIFVMAEREQMRMAVNNLVKNAVTAMSDSGTLRIVTRKTGQNSIEISFIDTGSGINPDHLDKVFLPLFSTKAKGIGLGLSISKMIVENHSGKISVEAEPGKGATFTITLPMVKGEPAEILEINNKQDQTG